MKPIIELSDKNRRWMAEDHPAPNHQWETENRERQAITKNMNTTPLFAFRQAKNIHKPVDLINR